MATRLVVTDGPALHLIELLWAKGHKVFVFLCGDKPIIASLQNLEWDNGPTQRRALLEGTVLADNGEDQNFTGTFNGVGAGLFDLVEPIPVRAR